MLTNNYVTLLCTVLASWNYDLYVFFFKDNIKQNEKILKIIFIKNLMDRVQHLMAVKNNQIIRKKDERIQFQPSHAKTHTKQSYFGTNFEVMKNVIFTSHGCSYLHFLKEMILLRLKKTQFQWYYCVRWRCSHSCSVYSQSLFLYKVGLTEVKENDLRYKYKKTTCEKHKIN